MGKEARFVGIFIENFKRCFMKKKLPERELPYDFDLYLDIKTLKALKEHVKQMKVKVKITNELIAQHNIKINMI